MHSDDFDKLVSQRLSACENEIERKGADYSDRQGDRLSNFKAVAEVIRQTTGREELPITSGLVWFVYFYKHVLSITKVLLLDEALQSEQLESRFTDAINYLLLGEALAEDQARFVENLVKNMDRQIAELETEVDEALATPEPGPPEPPAAEPNWLGEIGRNINKWATKSNGESPA